MEFFHGANYNFIGMRKGFYAFSIILFLVGIGANVYHKGPRLGIEFTGGTLVEVKFKDLPPVDKVRQSLDNAKFEGFAVQTQPDDSSIIVRLQQTHEGRNDLGARVIDALKKDFSGNVHDIPDRVEFVGPVIGKQLVTNALLAIVGSLLVIVVYVAFRFRNWLWGSVGVFALAHDVFVTFCLLVLLNREITLVIVAALLTLAGYSINDTIVIFDRVRENLRTSRKEDLPTLYNRSVNETLGRTINTSLTAFIGACSLFFAGQVLRDFALAMAFGIFIGTYSSIFCVTLVYEYQMHKKRA
jgi:preprotein translocase subunit SecF